VALAAQAVSGSLTPRELATAIHRYFGHNLLPLAERLAVLDDEYDLGNYAIMTPEQSTRKSSPKPVGSPTNKPTSGPRTTTSNQLTHPTGTVPRTAGRVATRRATAAATERDAGLGTGLRYRRLGTRGLSVQHVMHGAHISYSCAKPIAAPKGLTATTSSSPAAMPPSCSKLPARTGSLTQNGGRGRVTLVTGWYAFTPVTLPTGAGAGIVRAADFRLRPRYRFAIPCRYHPAHTRA
jgi:hypothetical protein